MLQETGSDAAPNSFLLQQLPEAISSLEPWQRVLLLVAVGVGGHFLVRGLKLGSRWLLTSGAPGAGEREEQLHHQYPKLATLISLVASALIFFIYFGALGLALSEANVRITTYLASASVVGLAVGFGTQGLVQDVVTGLTLIFSDYLRIGDVVEIGTQTGTVEQVGLRFTRLTNFMGATVVVPNRNIAQMSRFRRDVVRMFVDARVPADLSPTDVLAVVEQEARGLQGQIPAVIVSAPESMGVLDAGEGAWRFVRIKFRIWPGQQEVVSKAIQAALTAELKRAFPDSESPQITVTYRIDS